MKLLRLFLVAVLIPEVAIAQLSDTTYLQEVKVYGIPFTAYATGSTIEKIKSDSTTETLADRLLNNTTLYLKTYGNGQLTTISMRGTTASQTAVLWNGININSPTLGQTDFSLLPLFLIDEVSVRYGSSSALYGSDAIGGSILLGQAPPLFIRHLQLSGIQEFGSFGKTSTGVKVYTGNNRWEFRTKFSHTYLENDFKYISPANGYEKVQEHASVINYGFDQQVFYKISSKQQVSLEGMVTHNFREVQAAVTNNDADETLEDNNLRFCLNYINEARAGIISATAAYVNNDQHYSDSGIESKVQSTQISTLINVDKSINLRNNLRYGLSFNHYTATSKNYEIGLSENRFDLFASYRLALSGLMIISLDLRQALYNKRYAPFTPSIGWEWILADGVENKVMWRAQAGRGFRIPTLNDRYWQPGGNPDIQSEQSYNIETGIRWNYFNKRRHGFLDLTTYRNWMDDMIVWLPTEENGDRWSPANLQQVHVHGVEVRSELQEQIQKVKIILQASYSFTKSINKKGLNETDHSTINKQLAYVPVHTARATMGLYYEGWAGNTQVSFVGERFPSLDNASTSALDPYALLSFDVSKRIIFTKWNMLVKGECDNVLNIYYENLRHHAMPGRSYTVSVFINFNNH